MNHRPRRPTLLATLVAAPLALALVACGSNDADNAGDTDPASSDTDAATGSSAPAEPAPPSDSSSDPATEPAPEPSNPSSAAPSGEAGLDAARTALGAVDGTVFSLDREATGWEVHVVAGDGTENEVQVSADGASVTRGPVVDPDDTDDRDDLAERQRLLQDASVGYVAALRTASAEVPGGTVTGLDLDLDTGVPAWDVQLDEDTASEQTVVIDAASGAVLRVELDD